MLGGGAVVSIYSQNPYPSNDLDFIRVGLGRRVDSAMKSLGFSREPVDQHWKHPETDFWIEFPMGPVKVGHETINDFSEIRNDFGVLRLLFPTDCVMDRLSKYYFWQDTEALEQAVAVALARPVDLERIERWSKRGRAQRGYHDFVEALVRAEGASRS